ncbi:hypothetical protein GMSM_07890 [Geomonas sp. Red276]
MVPLKKKGEYRFGIPLFRASSAELCSPIPFLGQAKPVRNKAGSEVAHADQSPLLGLVLSPG